MVVGVKEIAKIQAKARAKTKEQTKAEAKQQAQVEAEMKVRRITQNKEPITDVAQPIYMERGVRMASCDIRTDRWEIAREAKEVS